MCEMDRDTPIKWQFSPLTMACVCVYGNVSPIGKLTRFLVIQMKPIVMGTIRHILSQSESVQL